MILKKINFLLIIGLFSSFLQKLSAQQTPIFSEYNYNTFILNPAFAGFEKNAELTFSNAGFFDQFDGAPQNMSLSFNSALRNKSIGIGAGITQNEIGVTSVTTAFVAYSYKLFFDTKKNRHYYEHYYPMVFSFGITAGAQMYRENLLRLEVIDDSKFQENINTTIPMVGLGFMFNYKDLFAGISTPNVIGNSFSSATSIKVTNPLYAYFGYRFYTNIFKKTMIKPSFLLKKEKGNPLQADMNIAFSFNNKLELAAGYRTNNSINLLVGLYAFKNIRFVYNYNIAISNTPINSIQGLVINYRFGDGFRKK